MPRHLIPLLTLLSDGHFHSGHELGDSLNVSRAAIWKSIKKIEGLGVEIHSVRGKGYRLVGGMELLDEQLILADVASLHVRKIAEVELLTSVDSTNSHALRKIQVDGREFSADRILLCLAEQQTSGKGRRGREWVSPFGRNIYLSLVRGFGSGAVGLEGLSLVVGLALIRALTLSGLSELGVKWPNDVLWRGRKLAGILLEMTGDVTGACHVVIGLGVNVQVSREVMAGVAQPWVDLSEIAATQGGVTMGRNELIGKVVNQLVLILDEFERFGFAHFMQEWAALDVIEGVEVELRRSLEDAAAGVLGVARGVNETGAFLLETNEGVQVFHGGELSVRRQVLDDS